MSLFEVSTTYKPFKYPKAMEFAVESERVHWIEEEVELGEDVAQWKGGQITDGEKDFITQILRMFIQSDVNVSAYYLDYLIPHFKNKEVRAMLVSFAGREEIHKRAYALNNDTLGLPEGDYSAFLQWKEMADKHEFMLDADPSSKRGLAHALAKSVFNEGVSLFASFIMLLNFQRRGLMKGMGKVVEWSVRDETMHCYGIAWLFRQLCTEHRRIVTDEFKKGIYQMARDCVRLEDDFIDLAFRVVGNVEGLTPDDVKQYIRYIADRRLVMIGLKPNWNIEENPLPWVDVILNAGDHTNFFENKVTEYELASLVGEWKYSTAEYVIYGRDKCQYCLQAKELLEVLNIEYEYVDMSDVEARNKWYDEAGITERRVPQVYELRAEEMVRIGGFSQLRKHLIGLGALPSEAAE